MKFFLLKMKVNGIKNINKPITLDFYKNNLEKVINTKDSHIKAIYGPNGSGKTAIIYAIEVYKDLLFKSSSIHLYNYNDIFKKLINQKNDRFQISMTFATVDEGFVKDIYEHEIEVLKKGSFVHISKESLKKLSGLNLGKTEKYKEIYSIDNGILSLNLRYKCTEQLKNKTMNLLEKQTMISAVLELEDDIKNEMDDELKSSIYNVIGFASNVVVLLQESDRNSINFYSVYSVLNSVNDLKERVDEKTFLELLTNNKLEKKSQDMVLKNDFDKYKKHITNLAEFLKIIKPNLNHIEIDCIERAEILECKNILVYEDGCRVDKIDESTGIKKLMNIFGTLCSLEKGAIVFIDELDANLHDVLLMKLIEYIRDYSSGQLIFTTHNISPMDILQKAKYSLDFLSLDSRMSSWKKNGNYTASSLYKKGLIEFSPFNLESTNFLGIFDEDQN